MFYFENLARIHQEELFDEAAKHRMLSSAIAHTNNKKTAIQALLAWLSLQFCVLSSRLQRYFRKQETVPPSAVLDGCV